MNEALYPYSTGKNAIKIEFETEEKADQYIAEHYTEQQRDFFIHYYYQRASKNKPSMFIDKPNLQKTLEDASPEKIQAVEEKSRAEKLEIAVKLNSIDLIKEKEIWLGTIDSVNSRRTYRNGIDKFQKYCESNYFKPMLLSPDDVRGFVNWLKTNGATTPTVRSVISSCKKLFYSLLENIPAHPNPFNQRGILPRKDKRVKPLLVPDQNDLVRVLDYFQKEEKLIPYTAIKLIGKYGMRIGAFQKMKVREKKAVTESKGGKHSFMFDDEDITLLKACSLNEYTAEQLGGIVNYHLEKAYKKGVTREKYSVHDFRHYFATDFYTKNKDTNPNSVILELSKKLGHKSIFTTEVYLESLKKESL